MDHTLEDDAVLLPEGRVMIAHTAAEPSRNALERLEVVRLLAAIRSKYLSIDKARDLFAGVEQPVCSC